MKSVQEEKKFFFGSFAESEDKFVTFIKGIRKNVRYLPPKEQKAQGFTHLFLTQTRLLIAIGQTL